MVDNAAPTIAIGTPSGDHGAVVLKGDGLR